MTRLIVVYKTYEVYKTLFDPLRIINYQFAELGKLMIFVNRVEVS